MKLRPLLRDLGACQDAVDWVGDRTLEECWTESERADWWLWLAVKVGVDHKLVVLAACDCAEAALQFVPAGEERPRRAIETARAWCRGEATEEEVKDATYAVHAASDAAYAAYAAAYAAYAASSATYAANTDVYAAYAAYAAHAAGCTETELTNLVRERIPLHTMQEAITQGDIT